MTSKIRNTEKKSVARRKAKEARVSASSSERRLRKAPVLTRSTVRGRANACSNTKECVDWECYLKYTYKRTDFVKMNADDQSKRDSCYATFNDTPRLTKSFMEKYSLQLETLTKKKYWFHKDFPRFKFSTLEGCGLAWFNFPSNFPKIEMEDFKNLSITSYGPYPPIHLIERLMPPEYFQWKKNARTDFLRLIGARPKNISTSAYILEEYVEAGQRCLANRYCDQDQDGPCTCLMNLKMMEKHLCRCKKYVRYIMITRGTIRLTVEPTGFVTSRWESAGKPTPEAISLRNESIKTIDYMWDKETPQSVTNPDICGIKGSHAFEVGHAEPNENYAIEGYIQPAGLIKVFKRAQLNSTSVFLDLGSGNGFAMAVASCFNPKLLVGIEFMRARVQQSLHRFLSMKLPCYPIHTKLETLSWLDPCTHVYCFSKGMDETVLIAWTFAVVQSPSIKFVITTHKTVLEGFNRFDDTFQGSQTGGSTHTMYIYQRVKVLPPRRIHPIFMLPVFLQRLPVQVQLKFLKAQWDDIIAVNMYQKKFMCAIKMASKKSFEADLKAASTFEAGKAIEMVENFIAPGVKYIKTSAYPHDVYGDMKLNFFSDILLQMKLNEDDIFCDIGCGNGRLCVLTLLMTKVKMVLGVDIHEHYLKNINELMSKELKHYAHRSSVFSGDITHKDTQERVKSATVLFANNCRFSHLNSTLISLLEEKTVRIIATTESLCTRCRVNGCSNICCKYFNLTEINPEKLWMEKVYLYTRKK